MKKERHFLPDFVYGAIDGLVTTFAIVSGVVGASLSAGVILVLGFANVLADGFSMGVSNYLAIKSQNQLNIKNGVNELQNPMRSGLITFVSFVFMGFLPLLPFVLGFFINFENIDLFNYSMIITGSLFFVVGWMRGTITESNRLVAGVETLLIGTLAALISYLVGFMLKGLV